MERPYRNSWIIISTDSGTVTTDNDSLKTENSNLKEDNDSLKTENSNLKEDNDSLKTENSNLKEDNNKLKEELTNLKKKSDDRSSKDQKDDQGSGSFRILSEDDIGSLEHIEDIGFGGGGKVIKVAMKNIYALKQMLIKNSNISNFQKFISEYEIMSLLHHPNVLEAIGIFLSSASIPPSILLEYCPMNLAKAIEDGSLTNEDLAKIIYQIAEGMKYIHFKKVIHRDLKPTNILIGKDGTVKISDFGISKLMTIEEQTMTRGAGSQKFMAPEIINEEEHYDEKVDVYSFGVLVFFILSGGNLPKIKVFDIPKGKKADIPSSFTEFSKNMINNCWNFEAKDRPSFEMIVESMAKSHYDLVKMNPTEVKNVETFVKQHQAKLPKY
ncbi:hypothetical protein M9Y10_030047 [Tritrichomonas musculus]|uniref:mitogen-activated protein kinase kinase n=1 Tax=Tritrichomonas musculus TaxID=1915356 RepID=A0ABR2KQW7_9EUKA